ncbi:MAG: hypothetical protein HY429_00095 [Candidatus Levybacteria bacterium]|nr:hypothetical protein [Candidatus Levybacteria bacterium]
MRKNSLAQKIRNNKRVILYEFLPPLATLSLRDVAVSLSMFSDRLKKFPVDAVNIPEVREETRGGVRSAKQIIKLEPRIVYKRLKKYCDADVIINRPIVYSPWSEQFSWLWETYHTYGAKNFVFVGGESSKVTYPGISVGEAAKKVTSELKNDFPEILVGGIIIPTRKNEVARIVHKIDMGIEFFTTQILFETTAIKKLLLQLWDECKKTKRKPKMIFLSFAPATTVKDIELLQWLGVTIPQKTIKQLQTGWIGMGWRSIAICESLLYDILQFVKKEKITIPIGLNVEHVSRHNFELSFLLLKELSEGYVSL